MGKLSAQGRPSVVGRGVDRSLLRSLERLAKNLATSAQISFDEHRAFLFAQKARNSTAQTRSAYRKLVKNLNERTQVNQGVEVLLDNFLSFFMLFLPQLFLLN